MRQDRYDNFNKTIKLDIVDKATRWDNLDKKWNCTIEKRQIDITILIRQFEDYLSLVKFSKSENTFFFSLIPYFIWQEWFHDLLGTLTEPWGIKLFFSFSMHAKICLS